MLISATIGFVLFPICNIPSSQHHYLDFSSFYLKKCTQGGLLRVNVFARIEPGVYFLMMQEHHHKASCKEVKDFSFFVYSTRKSRVRQIMFLWVMSNYR